VPSVDQTAIERVFRAEYGRAVAVLVRVFGDIDLAEESVQDAFTVATARRSGSVFIASGPRLLNDPFSSSVWVPRMETSLTSSVPSWVWKYAEKRPWLTRVHVLPFRCVVYVTAWYSTRLTPPGVKT